MHHINSARLAAGLNGAGAKGVASPFPGMTSRSLRKVGNTFRSGESLIIISKYIRCTYIYIIYIYIIYIYIYIKPVDLCGYTLRTCWRNGGFGMAKQHSGAPKIRTSWLKWRSKKKWRLHGVWFGIIKWSNHSDLESIFIESLIYSIVSDCDVFHCVSIVLLQMYLHFLICQSSKCPLKRILKGWHVKVRGHPPKGDLGCLYYAILLEKFNKTRHGNIIDLWFERNMFNKTTLPETDSSPLKMDAWKLED